jgi:hypothetical protein
MVRLVVAKAAVLWWQWWRPQNIWYSVWTNLQRQCPEGRAEVLAAISACRKKNGIFFVSKQRGTTCGKSNLQIETNDSNILVYMHKVQYVPKVQLSVDITHIAAKLENMGASDKCPICSLRTSSMICTGIRRVCGMRRLYAPLWRITWNSLHKISMKFWLYRLFLETFWHLFSPTPLHAQRRMLKMKKCWLRYLRWVSIARSKTISQKRRGSEKTEIINLRPIKPGQKIIFYCL